MVELLIGLSLAMLLTAAMLVSYTFLVRSLIRSSNQQQLEAQSRRVFQMLGKDVHMATDLTSFSSSSTIGSTTIVTNGVTLLMPDASTVNYTYTYTYTYNPSSGTGTLTRAATGSSLTLLTGVIYPTTQNFFTYYDKQGLSVTTYPLGIKQIEIIGFTATCGNTLIGTQSSYTGASARLVLRSKHLVNY